MFYSKAKKEALYGHKQAINKYNSAFSSLEKNCKKLYKERTSAISEIESIEKLINSIANTPKEFEKDITVINTNKKTFKETENYAKEASKTLAKSGANTAAGVAGGAAIASLAPTAAMWVATTFGTASTGTAISALSGAAATNAALAWLGGGALTIGGAGMAGGHALLALAGPIGWGIAGVSTATSLFMIGRKNKKTAEEAQRATKNILSSANKLSSQTAKVRNIYKKTNNILSELHQSFISLSKLESRDYLTFNDDEKLQLGSLINNTNTLSVLLNETIGK